MKREIKMRGWTLEQSDAVAIMRGIVDSIQLGSRRSKRNPMDLALARRILKRIAFSER